MGDGEQSNIDYLRCSICASTFPKEKNTLEWNQYVRKGYGACNECIKKYRDTSYNSKLEKNSYNYITSSLRQLLSRNSFQLNERTDGSLRVYDYIKWDLRGESPNGYGVLFHLYVLKENQKEFKYEWTVKTFDPENNILKELSSKVPNVLGLKTFITNYIKEIGHDPYDYFKKSVLRLIKSKKWKIQEERENDSGMEIEILFENNMIGVVKIEKKGKWDFKMEGGPHTLDFKGNSFALSTMREYLHKLARELV
jgi:hypothetical protein